MVQKQTITNQENQTAQIRKNNQRRKNSKRENLKYHMQENMKTQGSLPRRFLSISSTPSRILFWGERYVRYNLEEKIFKKSQISIFAKLAQ